MSWNWLAGGTGVANTDGTIASTVSVNSTAGFSIVKYEGNATSGATFGHGLSQAPELIIVKNIDTATAWTVGSTVGTVQWNDFTQFAVLNTNASFTGTGGTVVWNNTLPSASVVTLGSGVDTNGNTNDLIAYCFHSVDAYSHVGFYTGNGNADGPVFYTGFRPAYLMVKRGDGGSENWSIEDSKRDPYNVVDNTFAANNSDAEQVGVAANKVDFVSNGVKIRSTDNRYNLNGADYLYLAFAEFPFKYSNAR